VSALLHVDEPAPPIRAHTPVYPDVDQVALAGFVRLVATDPASGDLEVPAGYAVSATLAAAATLDPDLVELDIDGTSFTVAGGGLDYSRQMRNWAGSIVEDNRELTFYVLGQWFSGPAPQNATLTVKYNGSTIGTASFTTAEIETGEAGAEAHWEAWATNPYVDASGQMSWEAVEHYYNASAGAYWVVDDVARRTQADLYWYCATEVRARFAAAGIVAEPVTARFPGSGIVQGWALTRHPGAGIVQGYVRGRFTAAGIVGVEFRYRGTASGIVGVELLERFYASGIVYGVNRRNVVELEILDDSTITALAALGVTFS